MNILFFFSLLIFINTLMVFLFQMSNYINCLLFLELIMVNIYFTLSIVMGMESIYILFFYLVVTVCEASLGLTLMICILRVYGGLNFKSVNLSLC